MDTFSTPLLKTKLYIPPRRANLVPRQRLTDLLGEAQNLQQRLTLISARAGAGKTTLVSEWLHQQERPSAWLSLDEHDNDPKRFFSYLVEALRQLELPISLSRLEFQELPPAETLIAELINQIASSSFPFVLVLDDYHNIHDDWIHSALGFLIEHQPPSLHLIITTRVDPVLPLAQLRARGQLNEIRDRDLLFTNHEVTRFFNEVMDLDLPADMIATIEQRTEGWIAGLQMAGISARGHKQDGNLAEFIQAFGGTNRFILDYLTEEVLIQQSPAMQDFLIETSILDRMCGSLCDAVCSNENPTPDSQSILVELERSNLFVISLDDERRWYRYHHLFADLLQSSLSQRRSAEQIRELHRRAGQWFQKEQLLGEAMEHILVAQDFERAADVIEENIAGIIHFFSRNHYPALLTWIDRLPEEIRCSRPWIDVYRANMLALNLQMDEVDSILDDVEKRIEPASPRSAEILGHIAAVRAYAANLRGDPQGAISMANRAREHIHDEEYLLGQTMVSYTLADTYFALDDMENASQALLDVFRCGEKLGQLLISVPALCELAAIKNTQGRIHQAEELIAKAYHLMAERNALNMRVRCSFEFGLSDLLRERNQLDAALEHAVTGIEHRERAGGYMVIGDLALLRALQARGDIEGAMKALRNAEQTVENHPFQLSLMIDFKIARVNLWLMAGDIETANLCAREFTGSTEREQITLARLWLAQGRSGEANDILTRQLPLAEKGARVRRMIEILALQSLALEAQGQLTQAEDALSKAVSLAFPEGYLRVFLDMGHPLQGILERLARRAPGEHVRTLLNAFRQEKGVEITPPLISIAGILLDPLSKRELEVLKLLAEGLSNKEIASQLFVAPGTIKQHLKNICRKLDVHGRVQAIRRGQELGLI